MKVTSSSKPETLLIHTQPKNKSLSLVRFRENIIENENSYTYNEYTLEIQTSNNLEADIMANYQAFLSQAKQYDKELMEKLSYYVQKEWIAQEDMESYLNTNSLDVIKKIKIAESKYNLDKYLKSHPLQWTDNKYYTITFDKTQQLTSKLLSATFAKQINQPYDLKWNDTEQVCEPWTLENLTALAFAIDTRVTALVTYQQEKERQIRDAETLEEINSIIIDYDEVKQE